VRERFRDLVGVQIVAFPQSGILRSPGIADLLDAAITEGADLLQGKVVVSHAFARARCRPRRLHALPTCWPGPVSPS
jgi:hypothetical protein